MLIHHCASNQTRGSHPYWPHNTQIMYHGPWVDGRKLGYFHPLHWMVCDLPWSPTINAGVDTSLNPPTGAHVRLIQHYTSNKARGSHPYWTHNTQRMDQLGWNKTGTPPALALIGVWCTMSSNHQYRFWHPCQSINVFMCEVDTPLYR